MPSPSYHIVSEQDTHSDLPILSHHQKSAQPRELEDLSNYANILPVDTRLTWYILSRNQVIWLLNARTDVVVEVWRKRVFSSSRKYDGRSIQEYHYPAAHLTH